MEELFKRKTTLPSGMKVHTYQRLVKARNLINRLIKAG